MACCGRSAVAAYVLVILDDDGAAVYEGQQSVRLDKAVKSVALRMFSDRQYGLFPVFSRHGSGEDSHGLLMVTERGYKFPA